MAVADRAGFSEHNDRFDRIDRPATVQGPVPGLSRSDTFPVPACLMNEMAEQDVDVEGLWTRYGGLVLRRCRQLLRDEEEALDVTQDVFVQLLRRRSHLEVRYPSSLLWKMATNLCLNRLRDRRSAPEAVEDETLVRLAHLEDPGPQAEARFTLRRLFARHEESTRLIAVLHFVDGLTLEQTAREVGLSVSGVRKRLRGLRKTLLQMEAS